MSDLHEVMTAIGDCIGAYDHADDLTARVADLVLRFVGPPSANGVNGGSEAKIREICDKVHKTFGGRAGRFSSFNYLRQLRAVAAKFPPAERSAGIPFSFMIVACDPETLRGAMAQAKQDDRPCSASYIRKFRVFKHQQQNGDDDQIGRLHELERRLVEDARFYLKSATEHWSLEERQTLAARARSLITSVNNFLWTVEPLQQAAE